MYLCIILSIFFFMYYPLTSSISNGLLALYRSNERTINTIQYNTAALCVCSLYDCISNSCIIFKKSQVQVLVLEADLYDRMSWGEEQERGGPFIGHGRKYTEWWWAMAEANKVKTFLSFYFE